MKLKHNILQGCDRGVNVSSFQNSGKYHDIWAMYKY